MKESHLILILGLAGFVVMADNWVLLPILPAVARSLVAFCFMGGGGVGTAIGGKIIGSAAYAHFYLLFGIFLAGLVVIARITVSETKP